MTTNNDPRPDDDDDVDLEAVIRDDAFIDAVRNEDISHALTFGDDRLLSIFFEARRAIERDDDER